jgi:GNAT superfamily N-acetyltransferase
VTPPTTDGPIARMRVVALDEATAPAWQALFEACGSACFCRYWHFEGKKNDWLERCALRPQENRDEQLALVRTGALEARGLLAMDGADAIGWMKLAPRAWLPKLLRQGAYRPLDLGADDGVWSIGCLLVRPDRRQHGVARALVTAAPEHLRAWALAQTAASPALPARAIEAYPRGEPAGVEPTRLHDEEAWVGTQRLYESCGYVRIAGEPAYPVMRRTL